MMLAALTLAMVSSALPAAFVPPPILMYHRVDPVVPAGALGRSLTVRPAQFEAQLARLKQEGLAVISMHDLLLRLRRRESLDRVVVATFDDGYADQARYAVPLLQRFGDRATFYIVTGNVGRAGHVGWDDLARMKRAGMDLAAHGVAHDDLSLMNAAGQQYQIEHSVHVLRARLAVPVESYAYPSGRFNRTTLQLVRRAGIPLAVTTDPLYVFRPQTALELTRIRVRGEWGISTFCKTLGTVRGRVRAQAVSI